MPPHGGASVITSLYPGLDQITICVFVNISPLGSGH